MARTQAHPFNTPLPGSAAYPAHSGKFPGIKTPADFDADLQRERLALLAVARDCPVLSKTYAVSIREAEEAGLLPPVSGRAAA